MNMYDPVNSCIFLKLAYSFLDTTNQELYERTKPP